ncbi:MAG: hypothetical protein JNN08_06480 [Bryobacterales bacterium]|nr:hypothetical protein [Bryobacterales bacterium]
MSTFTCFAPSSKSTNFDTNFAPVQSGAAVALGFGLSASAVATKFNLHRSTIHHWLKIPASLPPPKPAGPNSKPNPDASPSVRLKASHAVLKQD